MSSFFGFYNLFLHFILLGSLCFDFHSSFFSNFVSDFDYLGSEVGNLVFFTQKVCLFDTSFSSIFP